MASKTHETSYGLQPVAGDATDHAVVVLHGIMQTRDDMLPFAEALAGHVAATVYVYGYDHTRGLEYNGTLFADHLAALPHDRVDLVGYSMGGLVVRLAASTDHVRAIDTVVTLATPNRGALSNAQLEGLGQLLRRGFELIFPLFPQSEGIKDLTRVPQIMRQRFDEVAASGRRLNTRYVSVPALFYRKDRDDAELGPSGKMAIVYGAMYGLNLYRKFINMTRAHDGIVTEDSNNLTARSSADYNETLLAMVPSGLAACAHASTVACSDADHQSILRDPQNGSVNMPVVALVGMLLREADWEDLKKRATQLDPLPQIFLA